MIRIGKDKVDERYNISDEGIITDLKGNVQKSREKSPRIRFKGKTIYQILMWTNFGWRDGNKWVIHHLDKDPTNNNIKNLKFMLRSDHQKLHNKNNKGSKGQHWKRTFSDEWKSNHKLIMSNRIWVNNGIKEKFIDPNNIPEGFIKGRLKREI